MTATIMIGIINTYLAVTNYHKERYIAAMASSFAVGVSFTFILVTIFG